MVDKDFAAVRKNVFDYGFDLLDNALKTSHGDATMSPEEAKLAILALRMIVRRQHEMIQHLYNHPAIEAKKPLWKRLLNK